jgi:hypothetical protein
MLTWLSRVLPKEFVRRVAEPALADEQFRWARSGRLPPLARTRFVCSCLWVGVPRIFWNRRKPTRVTMLLVGCTIVLIAGLMIYLPTLYPDLPNP